MVRSGLEQPFKSFWTLIVVLAIFAIAMTWLIILLVIATSVKQVGAADAVKQMLFGVGNNIYRTAFFNTPYFSSFLLVLALAVGAGLISNDLKHNALLMYFSRAITRGDYIVAKFLTLVLFLLLVTLGPALLLWVGQIAMGAEEITTGQRLQDLGAITVHSLILTVPFSTAVLACSSLTKRTYVAGILWATIYFASEGFSVLLTRFVREDWCGLLSWSNLTAHLANFVYPLREHGGKIIRPKAVLETGWVEPFVILAAVTLLSFAVVRWRLRSTEAGE